MILQLLASADGPGAVESLTAETALSVSPAVVSVIIGVCIPLLTGIVTKVGASEAVKGVVSIALAAIAGLVSTGLTDNGGAIISQTSLFNAAIAFVISIATFFGIWQPTGIAEKVHANTPGLIGPKREVA